MIVLESEIDRMRKDKERGKWVEGKKSGGRRRKKERAKKERRDEGEEMTDWERRVRDRARMTQREQERKR